jgi:hypothetical protein
MQMSDIAGPSYLDLDLKIAKDTYSACWSVEAVGATWLRTDPQPLMFDDSQVEAWRAPFDSGIARDVDRVGPELFSHLFTGQVAGLWERLRGRQDSRNALRVRLDIRDPGLANLPWELMCPDHDFIPLALAFPLVRCVYGAIPEPPREAPDTTMLVLVSQPKGLPGFNARQVLSAIHRVAGRPANHLAARIEIVRHVTPRKLQNALARHRYPIVHYLGHGQAVDGATNLLLEGPHGETVPIDAARFAAGLNHVGTRLLVLSACDTNASYAVGEAALHAGIAALVAVRGPIRDTTAAAFAEAFYARLFQGESLESCMHSARRAIYLLASGVGVEWAAPVLYSNDADGLLFGRVGGGPQRDQPWAVVPRPTQPVAQLPSQWWPSEVQHRARDVDAVVRDVTSGARLVTIRAEPGSGASSLALAAALKCLARSDDDPTSAEAFAGVFWVSRRRPPICEPFPLRKTFGWSVDDLYQQLAEALPEEAVREAGPHERPALVREALRRDRYLVVIDDLDEIRDLGPGDLRLPARTHRGSPPATPPS